MVWRLGYPLMQRLMCAYKHKILMCLNYIRLLNTSELYDFTSKDFHVTLNHQGLRLLRLIELLLLRLLQCNMSLINKLLI